MDRIIRQITERTGISDNQAREAVQVVLNYLKANLPTAIGAEVDRLFSDQNEGGGAQPDSGSLGPLFGKQ